jgi:hypothetical protein
VLEKMIALTLSAAAAFHFQIGAAHSQAGTVQELAPREPATAQRRTVRQVAGSTIAGLVWSDKKPQFTFIPDARPVGLVEVCLPAGADSNVPIWLEVQTRDGALIADYSYVAESPGRKRLVIPMGNLTKSDFSQYASDAVAISAFLGKTRISPQTWLAVQTGGQADRTLTLQVNAQTQAKLSVNSGSQTDCQPVNPKEDPPANVKAGNVHFDTLCRVNGGLPSNPAAARLLLIGPNGLSAVPLSIASCDS